MNISDILKMHGTTRVLEDKIDLTPLSPIIEGLIKTYPEAEVLGILHNMYNLEILEKDPRGYGNILSWFDHGKYDGAVWVRKASASLYDNVVRIYACIPIGEYSFKKLNGTLEACGYFKIKSELEYCADWSDDDSPVWKMYVFEKKFDVDITDEIQEKGKLYHICRSEVVPKILSKGLSARTSEHWVGFSNPERVYFFLNRLIHMNFRDWALEFRRGKRERPGTEYSMLEIDVKGLNEKFYVDPRLYGGVYCTDWISPKRIKVVDTVKA